MQHDHTTARRTPSNRARRLALAPLAALFSLASAIACDTGGPRPAASAGAQAPAGAERRAIASRGATDPVAHDPDDPAIWVNAADPAKSLVLGTDKFAVSGALYVFGLDGRIIQVLGPLDRPNNVDVEYGVRIGARLVDIAVVTERKQRRLRVFAIRADGGRLDDLAPGGIPVCEGQRGEAGEPMGIALYKRPADGAVFAVVSPKTGGASHYLWQYRLEDDGQGGLRGRRVRRFGAFSGVGPAPGQGGEIEAVVVDDELGFVYYSDERFGIRKWVADPDSADAARELAVFGTDGYVGDREGLAIYAEPGGRGYLVSSDQVPGGTRLHIYARQGAAGQPHVHPRWAIVPTPSDESDGIEAVAAGLPGLRRGMLVMMNSTPRNFLFFDWLAVEARLPAASSGPSEP